MLPARVDQGGSQMKDDWKTCEDVMFSDVLG